MLKGKTIGVVIPAYNEAEFIGEVVKDIPGFIDHVYPIDDGSTDDTWEIIQNHSVSREETVRLANGGSTITKRITPVRHSENRGVGGAIKTGYRLALEDEVDVVVVINGDGQMDPKILERIVEPILEGRADYAKGNRLASADSRKDMSQWRTFGNFLLTYLTRIATGYWNLSDSQNGYTAISCEAIETLDLEDIYDGYGFLNDVLIRLSLRDLEVEDVEMQAIYDNEESGISYSSFVPIISWLLLRGFLIRMKNELLYN